MLNPGRFRGPPSCCLSPPTRASGGSTKKGQSKPNLRPESFLDFSRGAQSAPTTRPLSAHSAPTMSRNRFESEPMGPRCARYAPTITKNRFGVKPIGLKCAHYAPAMRPLYPETFLDFNRGAQSAPTTRPLSAHSVCTMSMNRFGTEPTGQTCARYHELNRWAQRNRFCVEPIWG